MVITVTLNPAIDKTIKVPNFKVGDLNRVTELRKDPGGKGINVSRAVVNLEGETLALGFLAGASGQFLADSLKEMGIDHNFIWLEGSTRTNVKVVDPITNQETEINEPGAKGTTSKLQELVEKILQRAETGDYVVLTGSLPPGTPEDIYAKITTKLQPKGIKTVIDTSGPPLQQALKAQPYLIKPNREELASLVNQELTDIKEVVAAGEKIHHQGVEIVVVSLGADGAVVISEQGIWRTTPPIVEVASTIGAGDTLLGGLTLQLSQGQNLPQAIRYATAASVGSVTKTGTQLCDTAEIKEFLPQVTITQLERGGQ